MAEPRTIVLCLDGTNNEPQTGTTNVARMFQVAVRDERQLVFYHPGVGTMGSAGAVTRMGKWLSRMGGLAAGWGIKDNIEAAYTFLVRHWEPGDRVFVFGFSRGAFTARALTGMLATLGLLRPEAENLVPYAMKLYASEARHARTAEAAVTGDGDTIAATPPDEREAARRYWALRRDFEAQFGNPAFPSSFAHHHRQIQFLGVWDTVKTVGWFNWKAQFQQVRWPFTANPRNVEVARHALALDEMRRPYREYRFDAGAVARSHGRLREVWFAGIHSDVGGQYPDHRLSDIAFDWMVQEAYERGLRVDERAYRRLMGVPFGSPLPADLPQGELHRNPWVWALLGGWHHRRFDPADVHPSVRERAAHPPGGVPYRPELA